VYDACKYLQSYGHWDSSLWLAKCRLVGGSSDKGRDSPIVFWFPWQEHCTLILCLCRTIIVAYVPMHAFVYSDCNNLAISNFAQLIWRIAFPPAGLPRGGFQVRRELSFSRPQEARRPRVPLPRRRRQLSRRARRSKDDRSSSAVPRGRRGNKDGMSVFPLTT
jgi:hypothetical protein